MKTVTILATAAALLGLGACDRFSSSGQSASSEKARTTPQQKAGPNAVQVSSTGLPADQ